jgi:hypothetical protein
MSTPAHLDGTPMQSNALGVNVNGGPVCLFGWRQLSSQGAQWESTVGIIFDHLAASQQLCQKSIKTKGHVGTLDKKCIDNLDTFCRISVVTN